MPMSNYRHSQPAPRVMFAISIVLLALIAWSFSDIRLWIIAVIVAMLIGYFLFNALIIEVSPQELQWYFGPGMLRKRVARTDIARVEAVQLPWMSGSGIGYGLGGWVYFIKRGPGVKITRNDGTVVTLGTDDQAGLLAALGAR
jgi:hypothetical protein